MRKLLYDFLVADHQRLESLLGRATENLDEIQLDYYHQFRTGLLRHIKMEEKVLFLAAQKANRGTPLPLAAKLRLDHGALTALMVVSPNKHIVKILRHILEKHDFLEESPDGMYDMCERLTEGETQSILKQLECTSEVPVQPHNQADYALEAAKRAMERAGFSYDAIID